VILPHRGASVRKRPNRGTHARFAKLPLIQKGFEDFRSCSRDRSLKPMKCVYSKKVHGANISFLLKEVYYADAVPSVPGGGTYGDVRRRASVLRGVKMFWSCAWAGFSVPAEQIIETAT